MLHLWVLCHVGQRVVYSPLFAEYYYLSSVLDACTYGKLDFLIEFILEAMLVESDNAANCHASV